MPFPETKRKPGTNRTTAGFSTIVVGFGLAALLGAGCAPESVVGHYQGYLEAEYVYVASPYGGALEELSVARGDQVAPGAALFALDPQPEAQTLNEARETLARARAQLADLEKGLRPTEIAALEAQLRSTRVDHELAEKLLERRERLAAGEDKVISVEELDQSRSQAASLKAQVARLEADLETARLGSRSDQVQAAAAAAAAAEASVRRAEWVVAQKQQVSTVAATVHDTLYRPGEWVAPGNPVVVLLPPGNIKVRFFVPEAELAGLQPGRLVRVSFDGANQPLTATVNYVSTRAEFTPPVIYSQQTRSKLVFMVEAGLAAADAAGMRPGQPVDVALQP